VKARALLPAAVTLSEEVMTDRRETPTAHLRWHGSILQQRWLITDSDGVSNPAYEWRDVPRVAAY
jgi:hypothetical protein